MASFDHYPDFEWTRPLPAEGGIEARSRRGEIGETWWSRRFIELLESFGAGSRLKRGRNYARSGQVTELDVEHGVVLAKVQGSRYTPYRVRIRFKALTENQWRRAERGMAAQALPLAKLLAGEMPHDIEKLFESCKLALFPRSADELAATCTCPDGVNPCKHIAATYYILAERFDEDPFLIFTWRGRDQDELVESLRARRARAGRGAKTSTTSAGAAGVPEPSTSLSTAVLDSFWFCGPELDAFHVSPLAGEAPDALLRQLGPAPVEVGDRNLTDLLVDVYATLAQAAERTALGE
ncbi:MAG TPA: SWIM zinc finger family protein [Solirubrobacteraceae bacterium]|nr:SWIM zinc finger family protein [Solirubrobacteraceae bacterium]